MFRVLFVLLLTLQTGMMSGSEGVENHPEGDYHEPLSPIAAIINKTTLYGLGTCGNSGRHGPTQYQCDATYQFEKKVQVIDSGPLAGVQIWAVPQTGMYSVTALGASGGMGVRNRERSWGGYSHARFNFSEGDEIHIIVGQQGDNACKDSKYANSQTVHICRLGTKDSVEGVKGEREQARNVGVGREEEEEEWEVEKQIEGGVEYKLARHVGGAGGGGGGTFVFMFDSLTNESILLVAAGGGGGHAFHIDSSNHNRSLGGWPGTFDRQRPSAGLKFGDQNQSALRNSMTSTLKTPGVGWGWFKTALSDAMELRPAGGEPCQQALNDGWDIGGGFGGGGGACTGGGGGGGYTGGNVSWTDDNNVNGQGGSSFINPMSSLVKYVPGIHFGDGQVEIMLVLDCPCQFLCMFTNVELREFTCHCKPGHVLATDGYTCIDPYKMLQDAEDKLSLSSSSSQFTVSEQLSIIASSVILFVALILVLVYIAWRRRRRRQRWQGRQFLKGVQTLDIQLDRLRQQESFIQSASMITEYNPNYNFAGAKCTRKDLREIPREQLILINPLGQGAFGEVFHGVVFNLSQEATELHVAVKTLPLVLCTEQAEVDFLMEALIMSKFNHPNIVRFIGVSFDKHPRFIVLELLEGGDIRTFLRQCRPNATGTEILSCTMLDLVYMSFDIAKGCLYLEDNHFIHRDIAARNCLLASLPQYDVTTSTRDTTNNSTGSEGGGGGGVGGIGGGRGGLGRGGNGRRVAKIADFGLARDIYRNDYYRKGGQALVPVKWMPPEAFLEGIFTSKTDVWSFGVLLWEIFSLGYMPYPGRTNQEVMELVANGERLSASMSCPTSISELMSACWASEPNDRPDFTSINNKLQLALECSDIINARMPVPLSLPTGGSQHQQLSEADRLVPVGQFRRSQRNRSSVRSNTSTTGGVSSHSYVNDSNKDHSNIVSRRQQLLDEQEREEYLAMDVTDNYS